MMIETGGIVFLSLAVLMWRMPRKTMLWFFGHPAWLEIPFSAAVHLLHYGTFRAWPRFETVQWLRKSAFFAPLLLTVLRKFARGQIP